MTDVQLIDEETVTITADDFDDFVMAIEPSLRRALVARYGHERGREATAEALAYAWQERARVMRMANPTGYLYRVGQSRSRRFLPSRVTFEAPAPDEPGPFEPKLMNALRSLSARQREAVILCVGHGWTLAEVAQRTGANRSSVHRNLTRGIRALRLTLGVDIDGDGEARSPDANPQANRDRDQDRHEQDRYEQDRHEQDRHEQERG